MTSRAKSRTEARRARIEEIRRAERARQRRTTTVAIVATVAAVLVIALGGWYLVSILQEESPSGDQETAAGDQESPSGDQETAAGLIEGERTWTDLGRDHVTTDVDYPMSPPAGGDHAPVWVDCDATVHATEIPEEEAVHGLEHGAVWITYDDRAAEADVRALGDRVSATPYTFLSPYPDQSSPITLTAWGHQLGVDDASDPRIEEFLSRYVQGDQTPEKGATCTVASMQ